MSDSLAAIYAELPELRCRGKCQESCGPILMSDAEKARFQTAGKRVPTPIEVLGSDHAQCPHLSPVGRCTVYEIRPLICRLWGSVEAMKCSWGCVPDRFISDASAHRLLARADVLPLPADP